PALGFRDEAELVVGELGELAPLLGLLRVQGFVDDILGRVAHEDLLAAGLRAEDPRRRVARHLPDPSVGRPTAGAELAPLLPGADHHVLRNLLAVRTLEPVRRQNAPRALPHSLEDDAMRQRLRRADADLGESFRFCHPIPYMPDPPLLA